jgi:glycosyltransferase involved in cell wall biosynthesis
LKLALVIGNRFNPWHFQGYRLLPGKPDITVFRAQSEIQDYFDERNDTEFGFRFVTLPFNIQSPNPLARAWSAVRAHWADAEPRLLPFHERLEGYDLIQSWELFTDISAEALIAHKKYGIPLAVMVWDNIPFNMERSAERRQIKRSVIAGADLFIVHSERSRRMLRLEGVNESRIALVPPGVDTEMFSPGPGARAKFGLSDDEFVILFVGWFLPRKGIDFLLFALRELMNDPNVSARRVRLLMVGSGPGRERVAALIRRLDLESVCTFVGSLPYGRMPAAYRSADLFALPSIATPEWQEQFGMSLLEAMACGTPIVTTRSGAIPEIVGDSAVLCQPNDFMSLSDAFRTLMNEPRHRKDLGEAGRTRTVEHFSLSRFADGLSSAYQSVYGRVPG